ncbi:hypothetical protein H6P81_019805 [Aristolochia fimbriata]|uniref:Cadmium-induced protein AS8 n=1 Tax=Aristolochia fimbriata TaxID=158543 RepID=A0AAV7DSM9_ARIFI|nr:hypothetical protein H6P81_019805 [Aristolochia fimbriata]
MSAGLVDLISVCSKLSNETEINQVPLLTRTLPFFGSQLYKTPLMIIKGLFRRYERWNPVHPTYGAFWGMGFGIGCGVGWGPGFGPEVIGYVGAGCGIGFSVGITLAGIGIGLPANFLFQIPCNALARAKNCTLEFVHSTTLSSTKNATQYGWTQLGPNIKGFGNEAIGRFTNLKMNVLDHRLEFPELNKNLSSHAKSTLERMKSLKEQLFPTTPDSEMPMPLFITVEYKISIGLEISFASIEMST